MKTPADAPCARITATPNAYRILSSSEPDIHRRILREAMAISSSWSGGQRLFVGHDGEVLGDLRLEAFRSESGEELVVIRAVGEMFTFERTHRKGELIDLAVA